MTGRTGDAARIERIVTALRRKIGPDSKVRAIDFDGLTGRVIFKVKIESGKIMDFPLSVREVLANYDPPS